MSHKPNCLTCQWFVKAFVDDHTFSIHPERIYDGMCSLEPLWQAVARGNEHYCSHHKSTMRPQSTGPR